MNKALGQVLPAALAIYGVALCALALWTPFLGLSIGDLGARAARAPWWAWAGGVCNFISVLAAATATQQIGSAVYTVIVACTAILLSVVLDQAGAMGLAPHPITFLRGLGAALAIAGIVLVSLS